MSSLNVGCGILASEFCDVNCDLYVKDAGHRLDGSVIDTRQVPNFVLCDAQFLPFKGDCFSKVVSNQVIEHVKNPFLFMAECLRVLCVGGMLTIRCPHWLGELFRRNKFHVNKSFNKSWFHKRFNVVSCKTYKYCTVGLAYFGFIVPDEFEVVIQK